jgi:hypothetical protein
MFYSTAPQGLVVDELYQAKAYTGVLRHFTNLQVCQPPINLTLQICFLRNFTVITLF